MSYASSTELQALETKVTDMQKDYNEALDTIWMLLAALLVFFMHAGFSLLEAGSVRRKNAQNILAKNLIVVTVGFLCWWVLGYALALGAEDDPGKFAGSKGFFLDGAWESKSQFRIFFFQGAFCATSATIVSGAMAERTQLKGFIVYTVLLTAVIYPVVVYWGWSGSGFLNYTEDGESQAIFGGPAYMDFAGSGIVHMVGGVGALTGAIVVGPRKGRYAESSEDDLFAPHSVPFLVLGTFCLWFGWYGFNPGSTGSMHDADTATTAGLVAVNTTLAPCVAGPLVFLLRKVLPPKALDVGGFCNGILAGLVAITAGCNAVAPWEAVIIGLIGGLLYVGSSLLLNKLKVDDVVDAFAVHGVNGLWGVIALGFFGDPARGNGGNGAFYGGNQMGTQLLAALVIIVWTLAWSVAILVPLRLVGFLRLSDKFQDNGADVMEHSPAKAYGAGAGAKDETSTV